MGQGPCPGQPAGESSSTIRGVQCVKDWSEEMINVALREAKRYPLGFSFLFLFLSFLPSFFAFLHAFECIPFGRKPKAVAVLSTEDNLIYSIVGEDFKYGWTRAQCAYLEANVGSE